MTRLYMRHAAPADALKYKGFLIHKEGGVFTILDLGYSPFFATLAQAKRHVDKFLVKKRKH